MIQGPANATTIKFRNHSVIINLVTASVSVSRNDYPIWKRPEYDPTAKCTEFDTLLFQLFELSSNPDEMVRHFWEFLGYLMLPSRALQYRWVLYGEPASGKHEIIQVVSEFFDKKTLREVVTCERFPPDRAHTDEQITYTMVIPFHGDFSRPGDFGLYQMDRIILSESAGMTAAAMRGLVRLIERGKFDIPEDCHEAYRDYFRTVDHVGNFLRECVVLHENREIRTQMLKVFKRYLTWSGEIHMRYSRNVFIKEIRSRGIGYQRGSDGYYYFEGLSLVV
jgi:phage/plasmid-associated DNA primase